MKEIVSAPLPPPPLVHNQFESVKELFNKYVAPSYARFDIAFTRGEGSYVWTCGPSAISTSAAASR